MIASSKFQPIPATSSNNNLTPGYCKDHTTPSVWYPCHTHACDDMMKTLCGGMVGGVGKLFYILLFLLFRTFRKRFIDVLRISSWNTLFLLLFCLLLLLLLLIWIDRECLLMDMQSYALMSVYMNLCTDVGILSRIALNASNFYVANTNCKVLKV